MSFSPHFSSIYIFLCLLSLSLISFVSCAGSSLILVNPNNPNIPRRDNFETCEMNEKCVNYYCATGTCYQQNCRNGGVITPVPFCVTMEQEKITFTAAIRKAGYPSKYTIQSVGSAAKVLNQMVILNLIPSSMTFEEIIRYLKPDIFALPKQYYEVMDVELGFFASTGAELENAYLSFIDELKHDSAFLLERSFTNIWSVDDNKANIFVNITNIQRVPATFAIQHCTDGTAVLSTETCPTPDQAFIPTTTTATTSKYTTTQLLTIILPASIAVIALIIAAIVIVRRRRANTEKRQTDQQNEAVEVNVA